MAQLEVNSRALTRRLLELRSRQQR
jgi:hypothetical protein